VGVAGTGSRGFIKRPKAEPSGRHKSGLEGGKNGPLVSGITGEEGVPRVLREKPKRVVGREKGEGRFSAYRYQGERTERGECLGLGCHYPLGRCERFTTVNRAKRPSVHGLRPKGSSHRKDEEGLDNPGETDNTQDRKESRTQEYAETLGG